MGKKSNEAVQIVFPEGSINQEVFGNSLAQADPLVKKEGAYRFFFPINCFLPLDVIISSACILNQLALCRCKVTLLWDNTGDAFQYCERMGFFEVLDSAVKVRPVRPKGDTSAYRRYRGSNQKLLEMSPIPADPKKSDTLLLALSERLESNLADVRHAKQVKRDIWTVAAELVDNIFQHSETPIPGIIAVQRYATKNGAKIALCIADSGLGVLSTIRSSDPSTYAVQTDADLLLNAFKIGISRRIKVESGRGCGLTRCADIAAKYKANLTIRTNTTWGKLVVESARTHATLGILEEDRPLIKGTVVLFDFYVDKIS